VKTLYLLRHAKSSWDDPDLRDHDRPLNDRGRGAAPKMGKHMAEQGWLPQLVMSSTSQRTRETWDLLSPELDGAPDEVEFSEELYHAHAGTLLTLIEGLDDGWDSAMLIGHNRTKVPHRSTGRLRVRCGFMVRRTREGRQSDRLREAEEALVEFPRISGQVRTAVQSVQPSLHPRESGASAAQQRSRGLRPGDR